MNQPGSGERPTLPLMDDLVATGTFMIELVPAEAVLPETGRYDFTKTWSGEIAGTSSGVMLSAGDPAVGTAGYVALETFQGEVAGREGTMALQQFGTMSEGVTDMRYAVVPGSGTAGLAGLLGEVDLQVVDGVHEVTLRMRHP